MALDADLGVLRTTSSLHEVANDTGRTAYCGPYVLSAITGYPVSRIEEEIRRFRGVATEGGPVVKGTDSGEVAAALSHFGYRMQPVANFMDLDRKARPTLWSWMQKPRNAWAHYILAVHKGKEGHWVLVKGVKLCDTYSGGRWQFVCDGPHKGAKIMEVFEVRRQLLPASGESTARQNVDESESSSRRAPFAARALGRGCPAIDETALRVACPPSGTMAWQKDRAPTPMSIRHAGDPPWTPPP